MTGPSPLPQQEVVWFDVSMHYVDAVQLLHHVQDTDSEVHHQRLGHHLVTLVPIQVHCILARENNTCKKSKC